MSVTTLRSFWRLLSLFGLGVILILTLIRLLSLSANILAEQLHYGAGEIVDVTNSSDIAQFQERVTNVWSNKSISTQLNNTRVYNLVSATPSSTEKNVYFQQALITSHTANGIFDEFRLQFPSTTPQEVLKDFSTTYTRSLTLFSSGITSTLEYTHTIRVLRMDEHIRNYDEYIIEHSVQATPQRSASLVLKPQTQRLVIASAPLGTVVASRYAPEELYSDKQPCITKTFTIGVGGFPPTPVMSRPYQQCDTWIVDYFAIQGGFEATWTPSLPWGSMTQPGVANFYNVRVPDRQSDDTIGWSFFTLIEYKP